MNLSKTVSEPLENIFWVTMFCVSVLGVSSVNSWVALLPACLMIVSVYFIIFGR